MWKAHIGSWKRGSSNDYFSLTLQHSTNMYWQDESLYLFYNKIGKIYRNIEHTVIYNDVWSQVKYRSIKSITIFTLSFHILRIIKNFIRLKRCSAVKSTGYSSRRCRFDFQHSQQKPHNCVTSAPGHLAPLVSVDTCTHVHVYCTYIHTQHTHLYII